MGLRGKSSQTGGGGLTKSKGFYQKTGFLAYFAKKGGWVSVNLKNLGARIFIRQLLQGIKEAWVGCAENNDAVIVIRANTAAELELLSQGEKVSEDAQAPHTRLRVSLARLPSMESHVHDTKGGNFQGWKQHSHCRGKGKGAKKKY